MATNNYFGFTHGGTQYGAATGAAYQPGQAGAYTVSHAAAATPATYTPQRAGTGYETAYQAAAAAAATHTTPGTYAAAGTGTAATSTTYEYAYGRSAATAYDGSKTYYQQPAAAVTYSATESHYQASKPAYSTNSTYTPATRPATQTTQKTTYAATYATQNNPSYTSGYPAAAPTTTATKATTYSGYDAALYSAATMYVQQQTTPGAAGGAVTGAKPATSTWQPYKKGPIAGKVPKPKQPPKPQQLHYCDVCKISCAGPQTYREHLEGQKHKKKEAAQKAGASTVARGGNALRCELCDVTCTGTDAYAAHIRGAKHQKVVKLHTKLGKPIPSTDPVVISGNAKAIPTTAGKGTAATAGTMMKAATTSGGGSALGVGNANKSLMANSKSGDESKIDMKDDAKTEADMVKIEEKEIQPVGQDYIEEIKNDEGKVISFNCKLCECRFNDPNAKEMHMKGRRHRLQYKKKVNPDLIVDVKPSMRHRKVQEEKLRRQQMRDEFWRRREEERLHFPLSFSPSRMMEEEERLYWEERRRYEEEMEYFEWYRRYGRDPRGLPPPPRPFGPGGPPMMFFPQPMRRIDSSDDRHVIARHAEIYPKEDQLQAVQRIVSHTEKALKRVSDFLTDIEANKVTNAGAAASQTPTAKLGGGDEKKDDPKKDGEKDDNIVPRVLKGVMRVGVVAKGLLLQGDQSVQLVVLCSEKPTSQLLDNVIEHLPKQLTAVAADEKYSVRRASDSSGLVVCSTKDPIITVNVILTSPVLREQLLQEGSGDSVSQAQVKDPPGVLDKQKCLDALAALRHAKWFQARASGLQSCVMVIRILRDLCQRVPTWSPLNSWAMELLVEKVLSSSGQPLSPGDALRRVMEALASGILLPGGPGLLDPCEKDPTDAAANLTTQQREDITASAQHALRLIAFRQIHKVLGMDPLPLPKFKFPKFNRKRRRDNSSGEGNDSEGGGDGKKDKKEDGAEIEMKEESTTK